jgi:hypothetical protein
MLIPIPILIPCQPTQALHRNSCLRLCVRVSRSAFGRVTKSF